MTTELTRDQAAAILLQFLQLAMSRGLISDFKTLDSLRHALSVLAADPS